MGLEHVAIWTRDIERLRAWYERYFSAQSNAKYTSTKDFGEEFASYFLEFGGGCRLELMQLARIPAGDAENGRETLGLTHLSFSLDTPEEVDTLAARLAVDGYSVVGQPRRTGDDFYEACALDPDGNRVEFAVVPK